MKRKFSIAILLALGFISASYGNELVKPPPKRKPAFPKKINIPAPFSDDNCSLSRQIYPSYDCFSGIIDKENIGTIYDARAWKPARKRFLLSLFETTQNQDRPPNPYNGPKSLDLAVFSIDKPGTKLVAVAHEVVSYRTFGDARLDLSPYMISKKENAIAIRYHPGISGDPVGHEYLHLFRLKGQKLKEIFATDTIRAEYTTNKAGENEVSKVVTAVKVIEKPTGMSEIQTISKEYKLTADGDVDETKPVNTATVIWIGMKSQRNTSEGMLNQEAARSRRDKPAPLVRPRPVIWKNNKDEK